MLENSVLMGNSEKIKSIIYIFYWLTQSSSTFTRHPTGEYERPTAPLNAWPPTFLLPGPHSWCQSYLALRAVVLINIPRFTCVNGLFETEDCQRLWD